MSRTGLLTALLLLATPVWSVAQAGDAMTGRGGWENRPLKPGDIIRLRIWQEAEMSGEFPVDESGVVVLPRVGRMQVVDESPQVVEEKIVKAFEKFLQHSSIEVVLLRRIQVLGAVRTPGLHRVDATMTVSDVLALAGGTTPEGDPDKIELIRNGERIVARLSANTRIVDSPIQSGDQIFVPERSWLNRNSAVVASGLASLLIIVLTR